MVQQAPGRRLLIGSAAGDVLDLIRKLEGRLDVEVTSSQAELVERALSRQFDMVVVATDEAGISGRELLRRMAEVLGRGEISPILLCSAASVRHLVGSIASNQGASWDSFVAQLSGWRAASAEAGTDPVQDLRDEAVRKRVLEASFRERERLLAGSLSTSEVAELLKVSRQTPHDRASQRTLLAIQDKSQLRFPSWQFDSEAPNGVVAGLPEVLQALDVGPLAQARWLTTKNRVFENRTPLEVLKDGAIERVVREARGVGATAGSRGG